jgi:copper chaperone CopZ
LSAGAILAAALGSMCCIVPLGLGALGLSGVALSAFFEPLRPYLLALAALLLGLAFYSTFSYSTFSTFSTGMGPRATGEACSSETVRLARLTRPLLWVSTAAVIGLALFPSIASMALGGGGELSPDGAVRSELVVLQVDGMTCETCAPEVRRHLLEVPGVLDAAVSYEQQLAEVRVRSELGPELSSLIEAVQQSGYTARVAPR